MRNSQLLTVINKCKKGDRAAQNELYKSLYSFGLTICMRYIGDQLEARTVLNDGFYKMFRNIEQFNQDFAFKPWFKTIVVNCSLDYLRKNAKFKNQVSIDQELNCSIDSDAISKMSFEETLEIVDKLPTAYRTVFNLYVIDGYKHEEISKQLGISVGTSKSNLSRAKQKLREMINLNILA